MHYKLADILDELSYVSTSHSLCLFAVANRFVSAVGINKGIHCLPIPGNVCRSSSMFVSNNNYWTPIGLEIEMSIDHNFPNAASRFIFRYIGICLSVTLYPDTKPRWLPFVQHPANQSTIIPSIHLSSPATFLRNTPDDPLSPGHTVRIIVMIALLTLFVAFSWYLVTIYTCHDITTLLRPHYVRMCHCGHKIFTIVTTEVFFINLNNHYSDTVALR